MDIEDFSGIWSGQGLESRISCIEVDKLRMLREVGIQ